MASLGKIGNILGKTANKHRQQFTSCLTSNTPTYGVYVQGLHPETNEDDLKEHFGRFGDVHSTVKKEGHVFINFRHREEALICVEAMDRMMFQGRRIFVNLAKNFHGEGEIENRHGGGETQASSGGGENM